MSADDVRRTGKSCRRHEMSIKPEVLGLLGRSVGAQCISKHLAPHGANTILISLRFYKLLAATEHAVIGLLR